MKKKEYKTPTARIIESESTGIICTSVTSNGYNEGVPGGDGVSDRTWDR